MSAALCVGWLGFVHGGYAANAFSYTDKQTEITAPERGVMVAGGSLVWMGQDDAGWDQIFSRNLETGELKQLTSSQTYKERLSANGDYAVYLEKRQQIVLLNLQSGNAAQIDVKPDFYDEPRTDGHYVTYHQPTENMIYLYDTETKEVKQIGKGRSATIVDGVVAYSGFPEGDIMLYDVRTSETRLLWKGKSEGSVVSTSQTIFNGKSVVWTQSFKGAYQTRVLDVTEKDALPKVLNEFQKLPPTFPFLPNAIGSSIAAWTTDDHGKEQIVAAEMSSRQTDIAADKGEQLLGIYRDQLVLKNKDNKIVLRSLQLTGQGKAVPDAVLVSAVPDIDGDRVPDATFGFMGGKTSSKLASSDNSVTVSTDTPRPYSYGGNDISIYYQKDDNFMLTKALKPGQKFVSHPWQLDFHSPDVPFHLSMTYMTKRVPQGEEGKLGIYRLKSGVWVYMGGLPDPGIQRLQMDITDPGIYAVLYYDVPNASIRDYWQRKAIDDYNAAKPIRVFLDGEEMAFHEQPVLKDGSTTVEFRPIFEKLGLQIDWNGDTQTVTGKKEGQSLQLALGQTSAVVNGSASELPTAPFLNNGYTFVPLRFVGEATGRKVVWDPNLKAVYIYDPATEGKLYYKSGALMYEGQLKDGKMNGKGKLYREDGALWYDAEFRDNEVAGWGTIYFSGFIGDVDRTGDIGIGQFKNGLPDGFLLDISSNGLLQFEGHEIQGVPNGQAKLYVKGELLYDGEYKNGKANGYGKLYKNGKLDYEGYFVDGVRNGHGKEYNDDGTVYREGEYVNGVLQK
ncbi:hypothetical protein SD70_25025 [Gordoniibacillus kamchatkensis]|uniref:Copper amine oxidase-like N-terminal domain-containing protein n=1 Tax=Gordoniibacillus kamchatkensis TaxID=1590651 RepID=A0ABR5AC51_9BACL|nr:stalk domain-containing protein [Paenibacillus sp. VKM B-2647]KIL38636.1 hypothetical protein SD70_25025 [Paenibacillus sp. VKM B-2647]